jgi:hypothetical protein
MTELGWDFEQLLTPGNDEARTGCEREGVRDARVSEPLWGAELAEPLPAVDWLCPGLLLTAGAHTLVAGNAYSGKSLAWADVALAVAAGGDAWGTFKCKHGRVLTLDFDGQGQRISQERLQRLARVRGVELRDLDKSIGYLRRPGFYLDDADACERLLRLLDGISLCVIDSWRGATPNTDEWKRGPVQLVADRLEQVSTRTGCVIVTIDHNVKPPRDRGSLRSSMHDVHGTTAKTETAQSHFVFAGEEGKSMTHVEHKKERVHGHTVAPFALRFDDMADERDPRWGLRVVHVDRAEWGAKSDARASVEFAELAENVRRHIEAHPGAPGADNIAAKMGRRVSVVRVAIHDLLDAGAVVSRKTRGRGRGVRLFLSHMAPPEES